MSRDLASANDVRGGRKGQVMLTWIQGYCNRDSPGGCGEGGKWGMGDRVEDEGIFWGGNLVCQVGE